MSVVCGHCRIDMVHIDTYTVDDHTYEHYLCSACGNEVSITGDE